VQYKDGAGGTWTDWLTATALTSSNFNGTEGHTYYFQVRASDHAGNVETYPAATATQAQPWMQRRPRLP